MNKKLHCTIVMLALFGVAGLSARAGEATALQLLKEGNRYVAEDVKNQVVQIRSDKSVVGTTPNVWYVVYYDPDATFHATEVKFGGGKKMEVKRPMRVLELGIKDDKKLDLKKLNTDSDAALSTASKDPLLKGITLTSSQMWLEQNAAAPTWRVRLWAAKIRNPSDAVDIGEIFIQAEDGAVIRRDLHIDRLN